MVSVVIAEGGFASVTAKRLEELVSGLPGHGRESMSLAPAYESHALVVVGGQARVIKSNAPVVRGIEKMGKAARGVLRLGPHAVSDVVRNMTPQEADRLRGEVHDAICLARVVSDAIEKHHGDRPAGQQRLAITG